MNVQKIFPPNGGGLRNGAKTLIILTGPTAIGKTGIAIETAKHFNTVILSADSRQCYKQLNIGVARPSVEELKSVPHYFIASHYIEEEVNAAFYERYALHLLESLFEQYHTIVATGGTGLYIKALVEGLDEIPETTHHTRDAIIKNYEAKGIRWLQQQLQLKDPLFSAKGEMENPQRMMRALEVVEATGNSILSFRGKQKALRNFNIIQIGLEMPREILNKRINARVDSMIAAGLESEIRALQPYRRLNALQTVGYREMFDYFDGKTSFDKAIELIKQNTRRYAKRQMTWFKKQPAIKWIELSGADNDSSVLDSVLAHLE